MGLFFKKNGRMHNVAIAKRKKVKLKGGISVTATLVNTGTPPPIHTIIRIAKRASCLSEKFFNINSSDCNRRGEGGQGKWHFYLLIKIPTISTDKRLIVDIGYRCWYNPFMAKEDAPIRHNSEVSNPEQRRKERLARIFGPSGKTVIAALDDSAISGPEAGLRDMEAAIKKATRNEVNGILGFPGMFQRYGGLVGDTASILNITLSTEGPHHLRKVPVATVEEVDQLGLTAVSVHVNTTSPYEPEMLQILGKTAGECRRLGVPLLAHMYPRTLKDGKEDHYLHAADTVSEEGINEYAKKVRHAARIAADLGADIIKSPWTGSAESFHTVVESTYGLPVVMAGGALIEVPEFLNKAHDAMEAGAKGIAVGRNFFQQPYPGEDDRVLIALYRIVHKGESVEQALVAAEFIAMGRESREYHEAGFSTEPLILGPRSYTPFFSNPASLSQDKN